MSPLSRREILLLGLAGPMGLGMLEARGSSDIHQQILEKAAQQESKRRARFAAIASRAELEALQEGLRAAFLGLLGGLPESVGVPTVTVTGRIEDENYLIDKLVFESFPGYFVPALLYKPRRIAGRVPGILSPCGHSEIGKAAAPYQILHINLAKRGYVVLSYDPVGQGERSQFWDAGQGRSRFNLVCGEHAVLGNPLYLLGTNLARYRIWDGVRGLDLLASLPEVDATRIGCVGNSGGGNLTVYLTALDQRIAAAAICCYITTLPRRMGNRIQDDPDSDPEQDLFGFVSEGIDHAGLLAMCAPRPVLLGTARFDFFPIEGARESFEEARRLYGIAGAGERIERVEAPEKHGLSRILREAVYGWFGRWLRGGDDRDDLAERTVVPRSATDLRVCAEGQVNLSFRSRPLLPLAFEEFRARKKAERKPLRALLRLDLEQAAPFVSEIQAEQNKTLVVCVNGNETPDWREQTEFIQALRRLEHGVAVIDPRGVGRLRPPLAVAGKGYADPLSGVEANLAYNASLVGGSLLGMRVSDVLVAIRRLAATVRPHRIVVCGRRDAALVACFAAAMDDVIDAVAAEEMVCRLAPLFSDEGHVINAASLLPGLLRDFGDIPDVLAEIAPRRVLIAAGVGAEGIEPRVAEVTEMRFTEEGGMERLLGLINDG